MKSTTRNLDPDMARALMGEIIGATLVVRKAPGLGPGPVEGTIVDESLGLLYLRRAGQRRVLKIPKAGLEGTLLLNDAEIPFPGELLRIRPEDRTKRLAPRGRGRGP